MSFWMLNVFLKTRAVNSEAEVARFLIQASNVISLLLPSAFSAGSRTEWILTMPGIVAYKAQSLAYSNIAPFANADSWAPLNPPPQ